jgi:pimeloyl-ACP methyl ester carboxylesterase
VIRRVEASWVRRTAFATTLSVWAAGGCNWRPGAELPPPALKYVRPASGDTDRLVVFIHGFNSNSISAWTNDQTGAYWPGLIARDQELRRFAVLTAGFDSPLLRRAGTIEDAAVGLGTILKDSEIFSKFSDIAFVAHSTGGLVLRRILVKLRNDGDDAALRRIAGIFFMATPTAGSPAATRIEWLSKNPQTRDLSPSERDKVNTFLQVLDNDWEGLVRQRQPRTAGRPMIWCGFETRDTAIGTIVPALNAKTTCDEDPMPFPRDHVSLVKPSSDQDDVYTWAKRRLLGNVRRPGPVSWSGGTTIGTLVDALNAGFRQNQVPESIRVMAGDTSVRRLWIPRAEYQRENWGELFKAVAVDNRCLRVTVVQAERITELGLVAPPVACRGEVLACTPDACATVK